MDAVGRLPISFRSRSGTVSTPTSLRNLPSLDEAGRVVSCILKDEAGAIVADVAAGSAKADTLRSFLALTIAVLIETEKAFRAIASKHPTQWESLERSASTFTDEFVITWLAENNPDVERAMTQHRRRKLAARAGRLELVESDRDKRARWVAVTLSEVAPMPIPSNIADDLLEAMMAAETRIEQHLAIETSDPLVLAGQVVGLLSAAEMLLAMFPSNKVAAFCVYLASLSGANGADR